jgi:hypothetical protein
VLGGADQQVVVDQNLDALVDRVLEAGNESVTTTVPPDEDPFFLRAEGLAPNEHAHGEMEAALCG